MDRSSDITASLTESDSSKKPALEVLQKMGYRYLAPDEALALRDGKASRVLLTAVLKAQLQKMNSYTFQRMTYSFSSKNIDQAVKDLDEPLMDGLMRAGERIFEHLTRGRSFEEETPAGRRSFSFRYIDWENPLNNVFHVTEEFSVETIGGDPPTRRPDLVLFVNGIPLAVVECKKSSAGVKEAISQFVRNQGEREIPDLFKFTQILVAVHKNGGRYGTVGTALKFWHVWQEEDPSFWDGIKWLIDERIPTIQDQVLHSLLKPQRLLELIRSFTLYDSGVKKICRYQQYFAVKNALERVQSFDQDGARLGGLIWHTQGSGKSLTMVMLAHALAQDPQIPDSRIILVTDRIDLDKQIRNTFADTKMEPVRARTGANLVELLRSGKGRIITTVINKFESVVAAKLPPIGDHNLFILVDESHRSQHGLMHQQMRKVFRKACYIGFTGTPLFKKEKSSLDRFGRFIHTYTIDKAVADEAVVRLLYEGRMVEQSVKRELIDEHLNWITRELTDRQKEDLKSRWSRFEKIASSDQRLFVVAANIYDHYSKNWLHTDFNAMIATNSKSEAIRYKEFLDSFGGLRSEVIISPPDDREGYEEVGEEASSRVQCFWQKMMKSYGDADKYEDTIKQDFKDGAIDLLIVVDKLLTGFDAPRATVLYVDKPLREHGLLQAIARVNRVSEGKDFGYIIDYRGLLGELDKALTSYTEAGLDAFDEDDLIHTVVDIREIIADLRQSHSTLWDLFITIKNRNDSEEYEMMLEDEELRQLFYARFNSFSRALGVVTSSVKAYDAVEKDMVRYKKDCRFFAELRKNVKIRYADGVDFREYEDRLQKLLDNHISADGMLQLTAPVDIMNAESFGQAVERVTGSRAKADMIRSHLVKAITEKYDEDPAYYKTFSERIDEVLKSYREKRITEVDYLKGLKETLAAFQEGKIDYDAPAILKDAPHALAIYGLFDELLPEGAFRWRAPELALKTEQILKEHCKVDWEQSPDAHRRIEQSIDDLFYEVMGEAGEELPLDTVDRIIEHIKSMALKRFATR